MTVCSGCLVERRVVVIGIIGHGVVLLFSFMIVFLIDISDWLSI